MLRIVLAVFVIVAFAGVPQTEGHGMVMDPVNRASRWRVDPTATPDYTDNEGYCGGFFVQQRQGGKCGLCGDNYASKTPRAHENGGIYGRGKIVKTYRAGSIIQTQVNLTQNHKGFFSFDICNLSGVKESEDCFDKYPVRFEDGSLKHIVPENIKIFYPKIILPAGLKCNHCVLRWTYTAGNNWGMCPGGTTGATGCGPQEMFKTCSDIAIR